MNLLRERLERNEKIFGTLVSTTDPAVCEIFGKVGYGCAWVDMEHGYMSYKETLCHLNAARSAGICSLVRLPQNDLTATKKVLELGPDGVLFPMLRSAEEVREVIATTLYPPHGTRGFGPIRAVDYGGLDSLEYVRERSLETCRFVQIEHVGLLEELEEAIKTPYLDGFVFGPNDLSGSLGDFLNVFDSGILSMMRDAIKLIRAAGLKVGVAGGMDDRAIEVWSGLGVDMLFAGADWCFLYSAAKDTLERMKRTFSTLE